MKDLMILGIDGGATKISGWEIIFDAKKEKFFLGILNIQKKYCEYKSYNSTFKPVDIKIQLKEMNGKIDPTNEEKTHAKSYINAAVDVIFELSKANPDKKLLIGFGMPGLKTSDKKGISVLANGPRMPKFTQEIETRLKEKKITLFAPINHLGSDADYCGIGEEYDKDGLFRDVENAYYLGGGTGVADAMKLKGKLIPFDNIKGWIAKAWEMKSEKDLSLERYASAGGIQYIFSKFSGISIEQINKKHIYPSQILQKAIDGDKSAIDTINIVSKNISSLVFERISTIYFGSSGVLQFVNPDKQLLTKTHKYREILLDRIVIGQRLGDLLQQSKSSKLLWQQIINELTKKVLDIKDSKFKNHYLNRDKFNKNLLQISKLREAPAIGAGVDAYLSYIKN